MVESLALALDTGHRGAGHAAHHPAADRHRFYLLVAFSPQHPPGSWWYQLTGATLSFTFTGLVIGSVFYSLPFAVQPFQAALRGVSPELLQAGQTLGASALSVFFRVHLPLAQRGVAAGLTLAFAHTLGEFGVVLMIGGALPDRTKVASIALYDEVQKLNYATAHAFAAVLLGYILCAAAHRDAAPAGCRDESTSLTVAPTANWHQIRS